MDSQVEDIKSRTDIVELIGQSIKLTRAGRNFKGLCPFHGEHTPSFIVSPERGTWRCFGCGEHGDALTWLEKHDSLTFIEALEQLAQKAGIVLQRQQHDPDQQDRQQRLYKLLQLAADYYHYILNEHIQGKEAREYLVKRNIKPETSKQFILGYAPNSWQSLRQFLHQKGFKDEEVAQAGISSQGSGGREFDRFRGRLMFPISDSSGRIVGFSGRSLANDDTAPKYLNSPEGELFHKGRLLFGLYQAKQAIREKKRLVLVEGNVDLLASHQAGIAEVVAPLGTALTLDQAGIIKKFTQNVYLAYDQDKAGQTAIWRSLPLLQQHQLEVRVVQLPYGKDPDECIQHHAPDWPTAIDRAKEVFLYLLSQISLNYNLSTAKGKSEAAAEIAPFIATITDPVSRSFLLHQAADVVGISEADLNQQAQKQPADPQPVRESKLLPPPAKMTHQQLLATYFWSLVLTSTDNYLPHKGLQELLNGLNPQALPVEYLPIMTSVQAILERGEDIQLNLIAQQLPPGSLAAFDLLTLTSPDSIGLSASANLTSAGTIAAVDTTGDVIERLTHVAHQLNNLYLKQQLTQVTQQIKRAAVLSSGEQDQLKQKFIQISQEIRHNNQKGTT
jgi:DNA primase